MATDLIRKALTGKKESKYLDFKTSFDGSKRSWLKILKSIVAMANTDGGVLVFGVNDDGSLSGWDVTPILEIDPAIITDQIYSYTSVQFDGFDIREGLRSDVPVGMIVISPSEVPIVFKNHGFYKNERGASVTVFQAGTLFFRHGAKSEPANSDDIRRIIDKRIENERRKWRKEVRKVVDAPAGSQVVISTPISRKRTKSSVILRPSNDPAAQVTRFVRSEDQSDPLFLREELSDDLLKEVNAVLGANNLLAMNMGRFMLDPAMYYWVYANRYSLSPDARNLELLAKHGMFEIYAPCMYLLLQLTPAKVAELMVHMANNPKAPHVNTLIRLAVLLGKEGKEWLFNVWKKKMPGKGQHPDFYWKLKTIVDKADEANLKLTALRTLSNPNKDVEDGDEHYEVGELMASPTLADSVLTSLCLKVYSGVKEPKSDCRRLEIMAYADAFLTRGPTIMKNIKALA